MSSKVTHRFVGGSGRAGTSVLIESLGMHPKVFPLWETKFMCNPGGLFSYLNGLNVNTFSITMRGKWASKINACFKGKKLSYQITEAQMKQIVAETLGYTDRVRGGGYLINSIFNHAIKASGKEVIIEKTPHTVKMVDYLYKMFGNGLRYVHIVRDPREIYMSQKKLGWVKTPIDFIPDYLQLMTRAYLAAKTLPAECYTVVSYEAVSQQPDKYMRKLYDFLELPPVPKDFKYPHKFRNQYTDTSGNSLQQVDYDLNHPESQLVLQMCENINTLIMEELSN